MKKTTQKTPRSRGAWLRLGTLIFLISLSLAMLYQPGFKEAPPAPSSTPVPSALAVQEERSLREQAYDKDIASLERLLQSGAADADTQTQAAQRMERMISNHQSELALEEALQQAGFSPSLVLVQGNALTVMLASEAIEEETSASILNLCVAHTDIPSENIRIMGLNQ